jgi:hypothetical protein
MSRAVSTPFPPTKVVHHVVHHSKHHSSSKNKHNDHHKHSHSHSQPRRTPSPMPSFPISPSASFPVQNPQFRFPTVPHRPPHRSSSSHGLRRAPSPSPHVHFAVPHHRPPNRSRSSNALFQAAAPGYNQFAPPPRHSTKHHSNRLTKPAPLPNPDFQYSKCTGRRRALCVCLHSFFFFASWSDCYLKIGINYRGQENELRGCINDAKNVRRFLMKNNYKNGEIMILTEDDPRKLPTYDNIIEAMHWLVRGAKPHDSLFLHCKFFCVFFFFFRFYINNIDINNRRFWAWWTNSRFGRRRGRWLG